MKKMIVMLSMLLLVLATECYGAVSDDVYVRKDVFDANMQKINSNMERMLQRLNKIDEGLNALNQRVANLSYRVDSIDKRIDDLRKDIGIYFILVIGSVVEQERIGTGKCGAQAHCNPRGREAADRRT